MIFEKSTVEICLPLAVNEANPFFFNGVFPFIFLQKRQSAAAAAIPHAGRKNHGDLLPDILFR